MVTQRLPTASRKAYFRDDRLAVVDEIYRLQKVIGDLQTGNTIDFRTAPLRGIAGARVGSFRVSSPPIIAVLADHPWLVALLLALNYRTFKGNVMEMAADIDQASNVIIGLAEHELRQIAIGVRLLAERIISLGDRQTRGLQAKIESARRVLRYETLRSVEVDIEDDG